MSLEIVKASNAMFVGITESKLDDSINLYDLHQRI